MLFCHLNTFITGPSMGKSLNETSFIFDACEEPTATSKKASLFSTLFIIFHGFSSTLSFTLIVVDDVT